jgi:hypothetical protein
MKTCHFESNFRNMHLHQRAQLNVFRMVHMLSLGLKYGHAMLLTTSFIVLFE